MWYTRSHRRSALKFKAIVPCKTDNSDAELEPDIDDDGVMDPPFNQSPTEDDDEEQPSTSTASKSQNVIKTPKGGLVVTSVDSEEVGDDVGDDDDEEEEEEEEPEQTTPSKAGESSSRTWIKEDISSPPLRKYAHCKPSHIRSTYEYLLHTINSDLVDHIIYQTNLYVKQKEGNITFTTNRNEIYNFIGMLLYMGVVVSPTLKDYWVNFTRVPQIASVMPLKRFRQLFRFIHFSDSQQIQSSVDRFYKVRPLFNLITSSFLALPHTPHQSVGEVMVACKGPQAQNIQQYVKRKSNKRGFKIYCRASSDGVIHDMILFQGSTTFQSHPVHLSEEEKQMNHPSKVVVALVKTIKNPSESGIFADRPFTSLPLVEYLKEKYGCRYTGVARPAKVGVPGLVGPKATVKPKSPKGTLDFKSSNGTLALRWRDNKVITMLTNDTGIEPMSMVKSHCKKSKAKQDIQCPYVVKHYNAHMGGIDKNEMLTNRFKTPARANRWYLRMFGYVLDVSVVNAWLMYKRDCVALDEVPMPLKKFRLEVSSYFRATEPELSRSRRLSHSPRTDSSTSPSPEPDTPVKRPDDSVRYNYSLFHSPARTAKRWVCQHCSTKEDPRHSRVVCTMCKVALCLNESRNCFNEFHVKKQEKLD